MKTYLIVCLIALCAAAACTTEVPVTVEVEVTSIVRETVEVEATREVEVTREVDVTREVEVTREIPVTREVDVTREVPVTREVEATREIEVTREVEITRVIEVTRQVPVTRTVEVNRPPMPRELCSDYPYILALGELQRDYSISVADHEFRALIEDQLRDTRSHQSSICGSVRQTPSIKYEMKTWEGWGICSETLGVAQYVLSGPVEYEDLSAAVQDTVWNLLVGYDDYCENSYLESVGLE